MSKEGYGKSMMRCPLKTQENREILVSYIAHALNAGESDLLEGHLRVCDACREFVGKQQVVWEALDRWEAAPVTADFDQRLFARIEQDAPWWRWLRGKLSLLIVHRALPVTAVAALVAAGVWLDLASPRRPPSRPAAAQVEGLEPDQVVHALDEMEVLNQFNHSMKADGAAPKM